MSVRRFRAAPTPQSGGDTSQLQPHLTASDTGAVNPLDGAAVERPRFTLQMVGVIRRSVFGFKASVATRRFSGEERKRHIQFRSV